MPQVQHLAAHRAIIMLNYSLACGFWHHGNLPYKNNLHGKEEPILVFFCTAKYQSLISSPEDFHHFRSVTELPWNPKANTLSDVIHVSRERHGPSWFRDEQGVLTASVLWKWISVEVIWWKTKTEAKVWGDHTENSQHFKVSAKPACWFLLASTHPPAVSKKNRESQTKIKKKEAEEELSGQK